MMECCVVFACMPVSLSLPVTSAPTDVRTGNFGVRRGEYVGLFLNEAHQTNTTPHPQIDPIPPTKPFVSHKVEPGD